MPMERLVDDEYVGVDYDHKEVQVYPNQEQTEEEQKRP